ncbi:hypothetical protein NMG60_11000112 [Bertholletia excelsa]
MTSSEDPAKVSVATESPAPPTAPPAGDVENSTGGTGFGAPAIVRRWRREDLLKKGSLALRGLGFLFSLLAFIIMASNKHGDWMDFDKYDDYRYVLGISILSTLYTGVQGARQIHELFTGRQLLPQRTLAFVDFFGDQILAYLLVSSASSAVPRTNDMRKNADNLFTDSTASSISMEFLAFIALALSAMLSGYKLSNQSYI